MFNFGNFIIIAVGPFVTFYTLNYMLLALPTMYFVACWFIPETPYHSLRVGKVDRARKALMQLRKYSDEKVCVFFVETLFWNRVVISFSTFGTSSIRYIKVRENKVLVASVCQDKL